MSIPKTIPNATPAILGRFKDVRETGDNQWEARCPAHEDQTASLSVGIGNDGRVLLHCHAGCSTEAVVQAVGLKMSDLMPSRNGQSKRKSKSKIVAHYDYHDEKGELLFQVIRYDPKDFRQRRPKLGGGWIWNLKGVRRVLYGLPELLAADPKKVVFIVESEKSADLLRSLGLIVVCSSGGAGKWRDEYNEHLKGRCIVVLVDADPPGRKHGQSIVESLHGIAAAVKIIELPGLPEHGDIVDWLDAGGTIEQLREIVQPAPVWVPSAKSQTTRSGSFLTQNKIKEFGLTKTLADLVQSGNHFARDGGGKLYRYSNGVYRAKAERYIKAKVKMHCEKRGLTREWNRRLATEVTEFIGVDAPELWERPPADVLNVRNGLLQVKTRKLLPHSPDHLSTIQLPVEYDPAATCPNIEAFVGQVFPADAVDLAWQVPAWLMLPNTSIQKAVLLTGQGANGKSTWLNLVMRFLGKPNTAAVSLHKLESNQFAVARLAGKLANICPDLPSEHLVGTSVFKAVTGGDVLTGEYKFRDSFDFTPFCRLVFSANHPPRSGDSSHAFFRRWLVVPFDLTIEPRKQIPREQLDAMLTTPAELSGLLSKALGALQHLDTHGDFSQPESIKAAWQDFHANTDPLSVWIDQHTVEEPDVFVAKSELRTQYNAYAAQKGRPTLGNKAFGNAFRKLRPDVSDGQKTVYGKLAWCYLGIGLRQPDSLD